MGTRTRGFANLITASGTGFNTPAFNIEKTSLQTLTSDVLTKIQFNSSIIDTASGWSGVNYRYTIPSGQGGYWFISLTGNAYTSSNNVGDFRLELHKNGSRVAMKQFYSFTDDHRHEPLFLSALLNLSASDYLEGFASIQGTTPAIREDANETFFMGFRLVQ